MKQGQRKQIENIVKRQKIKVSGIDVNLTDEQLKPFKELVKPEYKNPYERVAVGECYYYLDFDSINGFYIKRDIEFYDYYDNARFENCNYYNDEEFAKQVAMELNLQQRLRKFTYDNGWSEEMWRFGIVKCYICVEKENSRFRIGWKMEDLKGQGINYKDEETAERAIKEIIKPFMKENPTFKW